MVKDVGRSVPQHVLPALASVLHEFLADNRDSESGVRPDYMLEVLSANLAHGRLFVRLTFRSGCSYCCFEPGCHLGLMTLDSWRRLRGLCAAHGVSLPPVPAELQLEGVVEPGARCRATGASAGQRYVETFREPV
jgi:hypothetical protein